MTKTVIKVENLSKIYRLGEIGTGTISRDMERWFKTKVLKQEDPFLKIGEINDRANRGSSDIVYSLRDINFEINQGDAVGIIGRNGAGKSTLLKILSRVTTPTTGKINIKGRVASLLEVGTGFHPELTGRENIYLNGAILGMRKREIDSKIDEIIDFSGVERYIDSPVKRYSSGMYVRLAFAVAAHLESEILIVDEVLAVGDAEFQKKCLGKMNEISGGSGRTILFVSHNLNSIQQLCNFGLLMNNGNFVNSGNIDSVLLDYNYLTSNKKPQYEAIYIAHAMIFIKSVFLINSKNEVASIFNSNESIKICVNIQLEKGFNFQKMNLWVLFIDSISMKPIFLIDKKLTDYKLVNDTIYAEFELLPNIIINGNFEVEIGIHVPNDRWIEKLKSNLTFSIADVSSINRQYNRVDYGMFDFYPFIK